MKSQRQNRRCPIGVWQRAQYTVLTFTRHGIRLSDFSVRRFEISEYFISKFRKVNFKISRIFRFKTFKIFHLEIPDDYFKIPECSVWKLQKCSLHFEIPVSLNIELRRFEISKYVSLSKLTSISPHVKIPDTSLCCFVIPEYFPSSFQRVRMLHPRL